MTGQIISFVVASAFSCTVGYYVYRHIDRPRNGEPLLNQRDLQMLGARAIVCSEIINGQGKVRLGDTVWLAEGPPLSTGTQVVVKAVHGSRLVVESVATG